MFDAFTCPHYTIDQGNPDPVLNSCNPAGISVLDKVDGALIQGPIFLCESVFTLVGEKTRLDRSPSGTDNPAPMMQWGIKGLAGSAPY